jgi:hypothetical protein
MEVSVIDFACVENQYERVADELGDLDAVTSNFLLREN